MLSKADRVKGQGVLSAHDEQVELVKEYLKKKAEVTENQKGKFEITHYHSINPEYYLFMNRRKRGVSVASVHFLPETVETSLQLPRVAKAVFYKYMLSFYKKADYLVTVNPDFINRLEVCGIDRKKVTYIPNVVSKKRFYPLPYEKRNCIRKEYGISENGFTVLCAGQLQRRKGVFDFLKIAKKLPDFQFVWAGGFSFGKISDGYEEIREAMKHLPANVKFLGLVDREKMNDIYNMADVLFLPSYEELFPMTILEAMNCALPVLVRDLELYKPIIADYVIKGDGNEAFISRLRQLCEDAVFYQQCTHASYAGHRHYSEEAVGKQWMEFYDRIAKEAGGS